MKMLTLATFALMGVAIPMRAQMLPLVPSVELPRLPWGAPPSDACGQPRPTYIDCAPGYVPTFDPRTCAFACLPFDPETPRPLQEERPRRRLRPMVEQLGSQAAESQEAVRSGDIGQAALGFTTFYEGGQERPKLAVSAGAQAPGEDRGGAELRSAALAAYAGTPSRPTRTGPVPSPLRLAAAVEHDSEGDGLDNTVINGVAGAAAGAAGGAAGGPAAAAAGAAVWGAAGAATGLYQDRKERQNKDRENEQMYNEGTRRWNETHRDYLRRRDGDGR